MNDRPVISVIIPMYNVEKYIGKCLESVKRQSFKLFEVIIVNDGTKDNSKKIAQSVIANDNRFKIVDKINGGLSSARNYGIKISKGEYIIFLDSDDYVSEDYLLNLYNAIKTDKECDIAISRIMYVDEDCVPKKNTIPKKVQVVNTEITMSMMLLRKKYNHCAYGKLYKAYLWDDMIFPEGRLYEDYLTTYCIFNKVKKVAMVDSKDYYYLQRPGSIMHEHLSSRVLDIINVSDEVTEWIYQNNKEIYQAAKELRLATYLKTWQRILNSDSEDFSDKKKKIEHVINGNIKSCIFYLNTPIKDRVKFILYLISPSLFLRIYNRFTEV